MPRRSPSFHILVVDDDPVLIDLIPWLLSVLGHTVETAATGELALQRLVSMPILDVVLIDLHMPSMDGATLAAAIHALPHPPRLIGMSGSDLNHTQAALFHGFLHKPFGMESLQEMLSDSRLQPLTESAVSTVLDTGIYHQLAASMPSDRLQDLYARTLDYVRHTAPALDTASDEQLSELAHTLNGSCAMVGAVELATLTARLGNLVHTQPNGVRGSFLESPISYKILRATDRLERILKSLQSA